MSRIQTHINLLCNKYIHDIQSRFFKFPKEPTYREKEIGQLFKYFGNQKVIFGIEER